MVRGPAAPARRSLYPARNADRHRHGLRRPDRLRDGPSLQRRGLRRHRPRQRHAGAVLRARGLDPPHEREARARVRRRSARIDLDIRDREGVERLFAEHAKDVELIVHTAAQPSHDWAASDPHTDFTVNANGTLNLLQAAREHTPDATFIFTSTNKVYGDRPNQLPLIETETRLELPEDHRWYGGIDLEMPIDLCTHSLFGVSKAAADLLVQEYGRYFGMPTVCFRGGCLTGPQHAGAQLHGFLAYLMRCTVTGDPYTIFGYGGKQVRDNIHAVDVTRAFARVPREPAPGRGLQPRRRAPEQHLDARGDRASASGSPGASSTTRSRTRPGSATTAGGSAICRTSSATTPAGTSRFGIEDVLQEIHDHNVEQWLATAR